MIGKLLIKLAVGLGLLAIGLGTARVAAAHRPVAGQAVAYDIVYVRQPRAGDSQHMIWPEVFHPGTLLMTCCSYVVPWGLARSAGDYSE